MSEINEQDRLNQLLCAYVLGEADAGERSEVESALARDPALREERDRLAATVGLVKNTLGKDETLSYRATSEVTRAAADLLPRPVPASRPFVWYQSTSLLAAASIVAVVGASYLGWRAFVAGKQNPATLMALGVAPDSSGSTASATRPVAERDESIRGVSSSLGYFDAVSPPATDKRQVPDLAAASAPAPSEAKKVELVQEQLRKASEDSLALRAAGLKDMKVDDASTAPEGSTALYVPAAEVVDAQGDAVTNIIGIGGGAGGMFKNRFGKPADPSGSDEFFLGAVAVDPSATVPATSGAPAGAAARRAHAGEAVKPRTGGGGGGSPPAGPAGPGVPRLGEAGRLGAGQPASGEEWSVDARAFGFMGSSDGRDGHYDWEVKAGEVFVLDTEAPVQDETEFERIDRFKESREPIGGIDKPRQQPPARRLLTPEERQARVEEIIASCRRLPNERPRDMFFRFWGDNPFEWTANDRQSTFSMDVDTASYTLARKYLVANQLPEKAQIRTEEFVNYFKPDVATPTKGTFSIVTECAPSRFSNPMENKWMLRVAVRGREVPMSERAPLALTLVVDVSGSMKEQQRLELVKHAMRQLVGQLDARDSIAIVAFSSDARLILPMTSAGKRGLIESAIDPLQPTNGTNTEAGLRMGYEQALGALTLNAINRVVLLTDGVANEGITDPNVISQSVERQRKAGIYLNTIGVGMNNHNDNLLEQLADKGDGVCNYVDDAAEVKHVLVDNFLQALVPIARDAKVQVDFDPALVQSYRLLGYENRAIADHDFRNDKVDAGEINSGHQITALYEIVRTGNPGNQDAPLAKVNVRFKPPHKDGVAHSSSEEANEISSPVFANTAVAGFEQTSFGYRRAVLAAQFAEFLRRSVHARGDSLDQLIADLQKLAGEKNDAEVAELSDMVVKSRGLLQAEFMRRGELDHAVYSLRNSCWERARLEAMNRETDRELLRSMDLQVATLEGTLRTLLENR